MKGVEAASHNEISERETVSDPRMYSIILTEEERQTLLESTPPLWERLRIGKFALGRFAPRLVDCGERKFYEVYYSVDAQRATAMLLKGIIPIADIVAVDDSENHKTRFFSWVMPADEIPETMTVTDLEAEIALIRFLFRDGDRHFMSGLHNVGSESGKVSKEGECKYYYFDFDQTYKNFWDQNDKLFEPQKRELESMINSPSFIEKLVALEKRLAGVDGSTFIEAIEKEIGKPVEEWFDNSPKSDAKETLQTTLLIRLETLKTLTNASELSRAA